MTILSEQTAAFVDDEQLEDLPESLHSIDDILAALSDGIRPEPRLSVTEWADKHRILPETSDESGPWRTSRLPYLKEIMDCMSPSHPCEWVSLMKGSQTGGTEAILNLMGYVIHHSPGIMLLVYPSLTDAKKNSSLRIDPLIESTPEVAERIAPQRSRDGSNSIFEKSFRGGKLLMTGAESPKGLRSTPARFLLCDEVDGFPASAGTEGDPVALAERRTTTFRHRRKIVLVSTPTIAGRSRIEKAFYEGDQRLYHVPCKACGELSVVRWKNIIWDKGDPKSARWHCPECDHPHEEADKQAMLAGGKWIAQEPNDGRRVSFHLPALLSVFEPWGDIAEEFVKVKDDPNRFQVWVNTALGETWRERGEAPEWERLYERREKYDFGSVPRGGIVLTAGADVQRDRIECEVVAWGRDNESWSVNYYVFEGDTADLKGDAWTGLASLLDRTYETESGAHLRIELIGVDEGYGTQTVRKWVTRQRTRRVMACKGQDNSATAIWYQRERKGAPGGKRRRVGTWNVGVSMLKVELYRWLQMPKPTDEGLAAGETFPPGYCHFPQYGEEHFKQLTAEELVDKVDSKGFDAPEWQKKRERNEALDTRILARAASVRVGIDELKEQDWARLEEQLESVEPFDGDDDDPPQPTTPKRSTKRSRRAGKSRSRFMGGLS